MKVRGERPGLSGLKISLTVSADSVDVKQH